MKLGMGAEVNALRRNTGRQPSRGVRFLEDKEHRKGTVEGMTLLYKIDVLINGKANRRRTP